jgi:hypothetical protein
MARRASRSAWRPRSRRTTPPNLCDAALHLIKTPPPPMRSCEPRAARTSRRAASSSMTAPRSWKPTAPAAAASASAPAGSQEELARGGWQIVVTEIPYLVQKSKLIEKIAELLTEKKLPAARRYPRRVRRGHPRRARTQDAHCRPDAADGTALPQHRIRVAHSPQHERALAAARCRA